MANSVTKKHFAGQVVKDLEHAQDTLDSLRDMLSDLHCYADPESQGPESIKTIGLLDQEIGDLTETMEELFRRAIKQVKEFSEINHK